MSFARFGIERLSPSSLNCWIDTPGLWTLRYLANVKDESGPAANRGTAVEKGLEKLLRGGSKEEALALALSEFSSLTLGELSDEIVAETEMIPGMVAQCANWLNVVDKIDLAATQLKVETWLDGVSIPVIGYVDFTFMDWSDMDLKTTKACPSKPRQSHLRQVALYAKARDKLSSLLYVTEKRFMQFHPTREELELALAELASAGRALERFLSYAPSVETAIAMMPHPTDHYAYGTAAKTYLHETELSDAAR